MYNLLAKELKTICNYLDENLVQGWIRLSTSSAGTSIFFVPRKDNSLRLYVNFSGLNQITKKNRCPLSLITKAVNCLLGAKFYTKLNIHNA